MSLEDAILGLTKAVQENTARLDAMLGGAKAPTKTADKPADKAPADKAPAKASTKKPAGPTVDDIAEAAGAYLKAGDKDERATAKANLARICEHFKTDRLTNADPKHYAAVLKMVKTFAAGDTPEEFADDEDEDEDEDGDSNI